MGNKKCFLRNLPNHFSPPRPHFLLKKKKKCSLFIFWLDSLFKFLNNFFLTSFNRENSPAMFPDTHSTFQTALFHPTPIHPKSQPAPEVRLYDPNTGKLIRKGAQTSGQSMYIQSPGPPITLPVHREHSSFRYLKHC